MASEPDSGGPNVLWHIPDKPDNISIGRQRIAAGLQHRGFNIDLLPATPRNIDQQVQADYDVVMTTTAAGGLFGPTAKLQGRPYIVDYVDPITQLWKSSGPTNAIVGTVGQDVAFRAADHICYVYDEEASRVERYGTPMRKTRLGVDYERFESPSSWSKTAAHAILERHNISKPWAVYIGGLEEIYNLPRLLTAAKLGGWDLVIAGTGEYRSTVESAATAFDNIHYLGLIDHEYIPGVLQQADSGICLVDDPHTVKVLEYAADLPVVHVEGRAQHELPKRDVFWTDTDPEEIDRAVRRAFAAGGAGGRLHEYARRHQWTHVVDDYEAVLEEVI